MDLEKAKEKAYQLLLDLGFSRDIMSLSPFQMSGGQMRKIAIVSILAMDPEVIILMNQQLAWTLKVKSRL